MHVAVQFISEITALIARFADIFGQTVTLAPAVFAQPQSRFVVPGFAALAVFAVASSVWAFKERVRATAFQASLRAEQVQGRAAQFLRDGLLQQGREAVLVWGSATNTTVDFGGARGLLEGCLAGADAAELPAALASLREHGEAFALSVRHADGRVISVRGCAIGDNAALYLHPQEPASSLCTEPDYRAALDAVPMPVWMRGRDLRLRWVNQGFLSVSGAASVDVAVKTDFALDASEKELAATAQDSGKPLTATCYATLNGTRRALAFSSHPLADGSIAGIAWTIRDEEAEDRLRQELDVRTLALQQLTTAVAVFGPDRRLSFCNHSYARLWGLEEGWLSSHPTAGQILDRLRDLRRLPEQHDFAAWKAGRLQLLDKDGPARTEIWYLPDGKILQAVTKPRPGGGVIFLLDDVSSRLGLESSYNAVLKVQKATLEALEESLAVFGPDGRLKLSNAAFARQWRLTEDDLQNEPHLNRIADICVERFGRNRIWATLSLGVTAESPPPRAEWCNLERSDGVVLTLSLTRMPDGSALAHFAEYTDLRRQEAALHEIPAAAIA